MLTENISSIHKLPCNIASDNGVLQALKISFYEGFQSNFAFKFLHMIYKKYKKEFKEMQTN